MDRALNVGLLGSALGTVRGLPTPDQLRVMLADAEVAAFFRSGHEIPDDLLRTAWHLHQVGTVRPQLQLYTAERQVRANAVAAHIFDLALQGTIADPGEQLVTTFAAQISSIRGDTPPNATALGRRLPPPSARVLYEPGQASLELGCAFLTLDRRGAVSLLRIFDLDLAKAGSELVNTGLASAAGVVEGIRLLQRYLADGDASSLTEARARFLEAANNRASRRDLDSRWVAAHLIDLCDDFGASSVWAILPPGTPPAVGRAMTLGDPPVMTLWPPQVQLLSDPNQSPIRPAVRRSVLTFPTSAGKTLLAQLLIAHHLAVVQTGVCFVAPSHSLCRELRDGLDRRLWAIRRTIVADGPLGDLQGAHGHVVVMTPEKLAARLRADEPGLLAEFGLFVLDEAHLVDDESRGWNFEATVSRLHTLTAATAHRIILLSAALGGTASVQSWLATGVHGTAEACQWRGPRRLHAVYATNERSETTRTVDPIGRQRKSRQLTDMYGYVSLYVDEGKAIAQRAAPVGTVERTGSKTISKQPRSADQLLPIVRLAAQSGSVLTVHGVKKWAENLAAAVAKERPERSEALPLVRLAEQRLGDTHGLVEVLRGGVAYHHAALPIDVQAEIEDAVRQGVIDIICATSTLTEGVNLPVRTVIVCERGYWDGTTYNPSITSADLMNAAGRAGRAGRETEGWVIINQRKGEPNARAALRDLDKPHDIRSTLNTSRALEALATYEALIHQVGDLALRDVPPEVDGFLSYCWYLADVAEVTAATERADVVLGGIRRTLAWQQLPEAIRDRWERLGQQLCATYEGTEEKRRRRWARSGTRLSANLTLETVADGAKPAVLALAPAELTDPVALLAAILGDGRCEALIELADSRDFRFKVHRYGRVVLANVNLLALVLDWVRGVPLATLAETHLAEIDPEDESLRFEQLSTFLARICEHHLPFTLGTLLEWIGGDVGLQLSATLPSHVHYGVAHSHEIELLRGGVRSRRMAVAAGDAARLRGVAVDDLRNWIADLGPGNWRSLLMAGPAEVADLLKYVHDPDAAISASLLDGETMEVQVDPTTIPCSTEGELAVASAAGEEERPRPLFVITSAGDHVARVRAAEYRHLLVLSDAGFRLVATATAWTTDGLVTAVRIRARID